MRENEKLRSGNIIDFIQLSEKF